ncbi:hypothetical protein LEMLEM_LOCUS7790, partial [Lemmus lemmus]
TERVVPTGCSWYCRRVPHSMSPAQEKSKTQGSNEAILGTAPQKCSHSKQLTETPDPPSMKKSTDRDP